MRIRSDRCFRADGIAEMSEFDKYEGSLLLAALIYGEARGERVEGRIAVGHVAKNRTKAPGWWGTTWKEVILKPYQFSCFLESDPNSGLLLKMLADKDNIEPVWRECKYLAMGIINGDLLDNTKGATHYHTLGILPKWAKDKTPILLIGNHAFYRI